MPTTMRKGTSDSRKTSSSERVTINSVTAGKDETVMATTPSDSRDRPTSRRLPDKKDSPYWYIENPRQHMHTDTADIEAVVFALLYPEEQSKSAATVPTVLEGDIWWRIPALTDTPENIQSVRISSSGCHGNIEGVAGNGGGGWYFSPPYFDKSGKVKGGRRES